MEKAIIVGYSEIALKGKNRGMFERQLVANIRNCVKKPAKIIRVFGRIYILTDEAAIPCLQRVFGINSLAYAWRCAKRLEEIESGVIEILSKQKFRSFRITTQRLDKGFALTSTELDRRLGKLVLERFNARVELTRPELNLGVEISDACYLFTERHKGAGGLPVGTQGRLLALIRNERDVLAAVLMMKRGCSVVPVVMGKPEGLEWIGVYSCGQPIHTKRITDLTQILGVAKGLGIEAVCSGDELRKLTEFPEGLVGFYPLVGLNPAEIRLYKSTLLKGSIYPQCGGMELHP